MNDMYLLWTFVISLAVIIVLILSKKLNPSLCLFIGAIVAAIIGRVDFGSIAGTFNSSFGSILVSTGILMVFAFTFSQYLNESGGVTEFAKFMVRIVGNKYDLIAMAIVGYILSIPVGLLASCAIVIPMFRPMSKLTGRPVPAYLTAFVVPSLRGRTDIRSGTFRRTSWHRYRLVYDLWNFDHDTWRDRQHNLCLFIFKPSQEKRPRG